jgi:hypothetical protein
VCGDYQVSAEEVCEWPELTYSSTTKQVDWKGCSQDCKSRPSADTDACNQCMQTSCTDFSGLNLVKGCFVIPDEANGADPSDTDFIKQCGNVVSCSLRHSCWKDNPVQGGAGCYCGDRSTDDCNMLGPPEDASKAACIKEWQGAARSDTNLDVQAAFVNFALPAGWAYFLLDCMRTNCQDKCLGTNAMRVH